MPVYKKTQRLVAFGKGIVKQGLFLSRAVVDDKIRAQSRREGLILQYHSVSPPGETAFSYVHPSLCISPEDFDTHLAFLNRHFQVVSLDTLLDCLNGDHAVSRLPVSLTFDDGYRDNYQYAFPLLMKHRVTAMFYLTTECIEGRAPLWTSALRYLVLRSPKSVLKIPAFSKRFPIDTLEQRYAAINNLKSTLLFKMKDERDQIMSELRREAAIPEGEFQRLGDIMLNWKQVLKMRRNGMYFGAHTHSHPSLPNIPEQEAVHEVLTSKQLMEETLSEEIRHFSYPNPGNACHVNQSVANILRHAGYASATTSVPGRVSVHDDVFQLKRKGVYARFSRLRDLYCWMQKEPLMGMCRRLQSAV